MPNEQAQMGTHPYCIWVTLNCASTNITLLLYYNNTITIK